MLLSSSIEDCTFLKGGILEPAFQSSSVRGSSMTQMLGLQRRRSLKGKGYHFPDLFKRKLAIICSCESCTKFIHTLQHGEGMKNQA